MSPRLTVDTTEAVSFAPVPEEGVYEMRVVAVSDPVSGEKAKYVRADFEFLDPDLSKRCGKVFRNLPIEGKGSGFFKDFWKKVVGEDLPDDMFDVDTDDALGKEVNAHITIDYEYDPDNPQNRIKKLIPA